MKRSAAPSQRAAAKKARVPRTLSVAVRPNVNMGKNFPHKMTMTHKYTENVAVNAATGAIGTYVFSANGIYDPNITSTGHQPSFFDTMSGIYNHYHVVRSKITYRLVPADGTVAQQTFLFGCYVDDDATPLTDIRIIGEMSTGILRTVPPNKNTVSVLSNKWSAATTFGGNLLSNINLQGTASSNPTEQSYFVMQLQASGANTINSNVLVQIEYTAVWSELKEQTLQ